MRNAIGLIFICLIFSSCASEFGKVLKSKDNEYKYKMAENYYVKKKYTYAQELFNELFPYLKGTPRYEDVFYKNAYSYYYQKDYLNAEDLFKSYVENFPTSLRVEECEYMRAYCYFKQSPKIELDQASTTRAMGLMQAFINKYPSSSREKEATVIIDQCHIKLEEKDRKIALLYYNLEHYRASYVAFTNLVNDYPDSDKIDEYLLNTIKAYYRYAELSIVEKQEERFEKIVKDADGFEGQFPQSTYLKDVKSYKINAINNIKKIKNEQVKTATQY